MKKTMPEFEIIKDIFVDLNRVFGEITEAFIDVKSQLASLEDRIKELEENK